jgi:hypothetical protein
MEAAWDRWRRNAQRQLKHWQRMDTAPLVSQPALY